MAESDRLGSGGGVKIVWSLPVRGETADSSRGDLVRARQLARALAAAGHEVELAWDASRPGATAVVNTYRNVVRRALPQTPAWILRDLGRCLHGWRHGAWVAKRARQLGAGLIIETQVALSLSGAVAARNSGLPLVLDDCSPTREEDTFGSGLPRLARAIQRAQARAARVVVAVSDAARASLQQEGVPADRIRIVPNGVDSALWSRADRLSGRRSLGLNGQPVLGFVGSFQPWHRATWLPRALAELPDAETRLVLVGDGPELESTLAVAHELGVASRVQTTGSVRPEALPDLVAAFDIGIMPGTNDYGQPMKLVEYAAAGVPCVAPDRAPVREVVEDGNTGVLFPADERSAMVASSARLLRDSALARRLGRAARQRALARSSWDGLAPLLLP